MSCEISNLERAFVQRCYSYISRLRVSDYSISRHSLRAKWLN